MVFEWYDQIRITDGGVELDGCSRDCPYMHHDPSGGYCSYGLCPESTKWPGPFIPSVIFEPFPSFCQLPVKVIHDTEEMQQAWIGG
jgi:hypothetical protein